MADPPSSAGDLVGKKVPNLRPADPSSIGDDLVDGIHEVTKHIFKRDTPQNRRKVHYQFRLPPEERIKGLFKLQERRVACIPSIVRADMLRRAGVLPDPSDATPNEAA
jgi:hypothetical protein